MSTFYCFLFQLLIYQIFLNQINSQKVYGKQVKESLRKNTFLKNSKKIRKNEELSDDIAIIHINDVHCGIEDNIGYDGFVLYRNELKKKYKNIITIDVGDHIQGGSLGAISNGEAIIKIMNEIGFDVCILGNHEFDYGIDQLLKLDKSLSSRYTCANFCYHKNKTTIFEPYKIIESGGKKIAFIGTVTPYTYYKSSLSNLKDSNGEIIYDFLIENNNKELYETLQKYINELKNGVDYVILLAHFGMDGNEPYSSNELLSKLEGVDAVLDGHTHLIYNRTSNDKNGKNVYITQVGTKLNSIGLLLLKTDNSIVSQIISEVPEPEDKTLAKTITRGKKEIWVDSEMNEFVNSVWNEYKDELSKNAGYLDFNMTISDGDSHTVSCRIEECTIGNLITDALNAEEYSECTLWTGNSFKENFYKGNITRGDLINTIPYFNSIIIIPLSGQVILDVLEASVSKLPDSSSQFLQVSGITFDVNTTIDSPVKTDDNGVYKEISGTRRVSNVKINGKNLETSKKYNVTISDYMHNGGNGLYRMLSDYESSRESLLVDNQVLFNFISKKLNGVIPEDYREKQGRINIDGKNPPEDSTINRFTNNSEGKYHGKILLLISCILILF